MKKLSPPTPAWLAASAIAWTVLVLALDTLSPRGVAVPMLYAGTVLISLWLPLRQPTFIAATAATVLTLVGFFLSPGGGVLWIGVLNRSLAILLIWGTAILVLRHKQDLAEIKTLRQWLPICASCKKIRDDKGYWKGLEHYMERNLEVLFTHSLCPSCEEQWYLELHPQTQESPPDLLKN